MDIRQFRNVLAVLEQGTLGRAAEALNVSQPALTKSIQRLEEQLQVELFERGSRGMRPTVYGECLRGHALSLSVGLAQALSEIKMLKAGSGGTVRIAAPPLIAAEVLPDAVADLGRQRPQLRVEIVTRATPLIAALLKGEFDFILTTPSEEQSIPEVEVRLLYHDRLVIVAGPSHPLTRIASATAADLQPFTWMLPPPGNFHRSRLDRVFEAAGLPAPQAAIECGTSAIIKALAARTTHIGLIPEIAVEPDLGAGAIAAVRLASPFMMRAVSIIWRKNQVLSPAAKLLMDLIQQHCGAMTDGRAPPLNARSRPSRRSGRT